MTTVAAARVVPEPPSITYGQDQPVLALNAWTNNAQLMVDVWRSGYLPPLVLDLTWGGGNWWTDLGWDDATEGFEIFVGDFRATELPDRHAVTVVYDPPYVSMGGRATSGLQGFMDAYGLREAPTSPAALQFEVINPGLTEAARISDRYVLAKTMDYVSSGKLWCGSYETRRHAAGIGLVEVANFVLGHPPGPQPPGRTQRHPRNNYSTLIVFRRRRSRRGWNSMS